MGTFLCFIMTLYIMHYVSYQERDCRIVRMLNVLRPDKDKVKTRLRPGLATLAIMFNTGKKFITFLGPIYFQLMTKFEFKVNEFSYEQLINKLKQSDTKSSHSHALLACWALAPSREFQTFAEFQILLNWLLYLYNGSVLRVRTVRNYFLSLIPG